MMNWKFLVLLVIGLAAGSAAAPRAETWIVQQLAPWQDPSENGPREIVFTLDGSLLSLNTTAISTGGGGSSTRVWDLLFSGRWGVTGTIDSSGNLTPDRYAAFVCTDQGGWIKWASDTPFGYTAPFMLGSSFVGDGAATYYDYEYSERTGRSTTSTLAIWSYLPRRPLEDDTYTSVSHTFYVTNVPEPAGFLAVSCALIGLAGIAWRRRR